VFPAGGSVPNASILNYELETVANATTVPLGPFLGPFAVGDVFGITVRADGSGTDFIADVNGYYVPRPFILESGQTLRGTWGAGAVATALGQHIAAPFTFQFPLASAPAAPAANIIFGANTPACQGTFANPTALPGQLCVYVRVTVNSRNFCIIAPGNNQCGSSHSFGAGVIFESADAGEFIAYGTWAVTAP
jgi:hypothetical protein